jgi:hypothetical protein
MNIKLAALAAVLLATAQAMAEDVRIDCTTDQRIICQDDETICRPPERRPATYTYKFTFDLTKKTGSLVFCAFDYCMEPSPLTVVYDHCVFLHKFGEDCTNLSVPISVWERSTQYTYTISNSRYVMTYGNAGADRYSMSVTEFGHCAAAR